jgi:probable HAF family extracellular repeat protein
MNQSRVHDITSTKTQTGFAPANGGPARPLRQKRSLGGRAWTKAGVLALLLGFSLGASLLTAQEKPQYQFIEVALPAPSLAYGINNRGLVTGAYNDPVTGDWFSFLLERGVLTTGIAAPGATDTFLGPANNRDVESGNFGDESNQAPVLYDLRNGTYTLLPEIPDMPLNYGNGINDAGHIVGVAYAGGNINESSGLGMNWFWDGRDYSFFTVPGSETNGAYVGGINDWDQISGFYFDNVTGLPHGFIKDGPNYTTLDAPGAIYTVAFGINNKGQVVGLYEDASHDHHGYIWTEGTFVTVDATIAGSIGSEWFGSNEHGDLAGLYKDAAHVEHAVVGLRIDGDGHWHHGE